MKISIIVILISIIFLSLFCLYYYTKKHRFQKSVELCSSNLTDKEYLQHMIPHHQVAVDISLMMQKYSKWPEMQKILRKLIWTQNYEIHMMKDMLIRLPRFEMSDDNYKMITTYKNTQSDFVYPNKLGLTNTYCDPHFFNPESHNEHIKNMHLTDEMYIKHMIPHHQVAVDMSKKLLKNTSNDFMIYLAYRIIHSQQEEITLLNNLLNKENIKVSSEFMY